MTPCILVHRHKRFSEERTASFFKVDSLCEDGGFTFLRHVCNRLPYCKESLQKRQLANVATSLHVETHRLMRASWDGLRWLYIHIKFHKVWFSHSNVDRGAMHRQQGDLISLVLLLKKTKLRGLSPRGTIPSDRRSSPRLVPTSADRGCHVVTVMYPYGRNLDFLDRSRYFFFQVAPQLYSRRWVDPVPDPHFSENLVTQGIEPGPLDL
jgi:hypothetical protein